MKMLGKASPRRSLKASAAILMSALLAACQSMSMEGNAGMAPLGYSPELPQLTCASHGGTLMGRNEKLAAKRVRIGDPAYIEFRSRVALSVPTGHLYAVFGRLDPQGNPVTRQYMGLFPDGGPVGLYAGALVPMPAEVEPNFSDCNFSAAAAYRVSLSEEQYQRLLAKARAYLADPPKWQMLSFNCNNFAASLGEVAGLREPANRSQPSFSYIYAYIETNGDD
jgi:hypothetical protein